MCLLTIMMLLKRICIFLIYFIFLQDSQRHQTSLIPDDFENAPKNWTVPAIFSAIFFLPTGIVAVSNARKVRALNLPATRNHTFICAHIHVRTQNNINSIILQIGSSFISTLLFLFYTICEV